MRRWALFAVIFGALTVSSCSRLPILTLVNNSGHALEVVFASTGGDANELSRVRDLWEQVLRLPVRVDQGRTRELRLRNSHSAWIIRVQNSQCQLTFEIPNRGFQYALYESEVGPGDVAVQLERSEMLYLVPLQSRGVRDIQAVAALQPEGFPISPLDRSCENRDVE